MAGPEGPLLDQLEAYPKGEHRFRRRVGPGDLTMAKPQFLPCRTCGKPVPQEPGWCHPKLVCRSGSFRASGVERPSKCATPRYDCEKRNATKERWKERHREQYLGYYKTPEFHARRNAHDRLDRKLRPDVWRERSRRQMVRRREREGRAQLILGYR